MKTWVRRSSEINTCVCGINTCAVWGSVGGGGGGGGEETKEFICV